MQKQLFPRGNNNTNDMECQGLHNLLGRLFDAIPREQVALRDYLTSEYEQLYLQCGHQHGNNDWFQPLLARSTHRQHQQERELQEQQMAWQLYQQQQLQQYYEQRLANHRHELEQQCLFEQKQQEERQCLLLINQKPLTVEQQERKARRIAATNMAEKETRQHMEELDMERARQRVAFAATKSQTPPPPRQQRMKTATKTACHQQLLYDEVTTTTPQQTWSPMSVEESQPMTPMTCYTNDVDID